MKYIKIFLTLLAFFLGGCGAATHVHVVVPVGELHAVADTVATENTSGVAVCDRCVVVETKP